MISLYDEENIADNELLNRSYHERNRITRSFYRCRAWKKLKKDFWDTQSVLKCNACGDTEDLQVDHIKPIKSAWSLRLDINNLQILCGACNKEKCNDSNDEFMKWMQFRNKDKLVKSRKINNQIDKVNYIYNLDNAKKELVRVQYINYTYFCEDRKEKEILIEDWIRIFKRADGFLQKTTKDTDWNSVFENMQKINQEIA